MSHEPTAKCFQQLNQLLDQELALSADLLTTLQNEKQAIGKKDDQLSIISQEKGRLLTELSNTHRQRISLVQQHGYSPDHDGTSSCVLWCDNAHVLERKWGTFTDQMKECRELNRLNGGILDNTIRVVKQALSILYGQQVNANVYDKHGHEQSANAGRSIAKV